MMKHLMLALLVPAAVVAQARVPAEVQPIIDSAVSAGLPSRPLVEKALEGAAKGASSQAITGAVRALAAALGTARVALGAATADELNAGAVALRLGARPEDLTRLRTARKASLVVPLGVLSDLVARGVPVDTASRVVVALASQGDDEYLAFRQRVDRDIDLGAAPVGSVIGALNSSGRAALTTPGKRP
ncbi:MAG TPA: hypothetical protein VFD85_09095 [Gemmatimonadales bacterium]|nr:hypothetical protein [Gemmatimonadales bacterium]